MSICSLGVQHPLFSVSLTPISIFPLDFAESREGGWVVREKDETVVGKAILAA